MKMLHLTCRSLIVLVSAVVAHAQVNIDPPTRSFTKEGGGGSILTSGSGTWNASTTASWLTITPRTSATAGTSCIYTVAANFSADTRQGVILIDDKEHTVTQTGYTATISPTSATRDLSGGSGTIAITVAPGVSWTATSNAEWATVSPAAGVSSGSVAFSVAPYTGVTTRTATLTIAGRSFTISQTGADVNITPREVEKAYSSDIIQVQVSALATTTWNVTPNASWISVIDPGNKFGDSTLTLAVGTNPSYLERTGTVTIGSATFTIRQSGTPNPVLDILPKEATADPVGAFGNIAVLATPDGPWTAESLSPWIVISQGASGSGNGNIQYVASANPGLTERVGTIQVTPPVYQPKIDLTRGLIGWYQGRDDLTGWERHLENAFDDFSFDGRTKVYVNTSGYGDDQYHRADAAFSIGFGFEVTELGMTHPLFSIDHGSGNESVIYVNEQNKLVVAVNGVSHISPHTVNVNTLYQVLLTQASSLQAKLYFGKPATDDFATSSYTFTPAADFFPTATTKNQLKFGHSNFPSPGILAGKLRDFRIFSRAISQDEAKALNQQFVTDAYSRYRGIASGRGWSDAAACNSRGEGQYLASPETQYEANLLARFGEDSLESKFAAEATSPGSGWNYGDAWIGATANNSYLQSGYPRFDSSGSSYDGYFGRWVDGRFTTSWWDPWILMNSTSGALFDTSDGSRFYLTETERPESIPTAVRAGSVETSTTPLYRYEFKGNALGTTRLPFRLTQVTAATDRLGRDGCALKWNGDGGNIVLEGAQAPHSSEHATYGMWLKFDALPQTETTLMERLQTSDRTPNFRLVLAAGGASLIVQVNNDSNKWATFPISLTTTRFHHLVVSASTNNIVRVMLDGSEIGNTPLLTDYRFGSWPESYQSIIINRWNGVLDDIAVYDGALTVSQIRDIYNLEKPRSVLHSVTQGVVQPALAPSTAQLPAQGGVATAQLTLPSNVTWTAETSTDWLTILSSTSAAGSATLEVEAADNPTVYERTGTVTIANQTFTVTQAGLNASVTHGELIFGTDGGSGWIDVAAEGNGLWQAISNNSWLTIAIGENGIGSGSVFIVADPYTQTSLARVGSVTIAGRTVYITQRGYTLSISPQVAQVGSNSGAGEFGVAAPVGAVWEAIVADPWITLIGGVNGVGNGTVRYEVAENTTGATRTGRIIVSGTQYTITQTTSLLLVAESDGNGTVSGVGSYQTNATAFLVATPASGYVFSHWTGDAVGSENPLNLNMDTGKSVKAHFIPQGAAEVIATAAAESLGLVPSSRIQEERTAVLDEIVNNPNSYGLYNREQMHGLALGAPVLEKNSTTGKMTLRLGLKRSSDLSTWNELSINGSDIGANNGKVEMQITPQGDAQFYRLEGAPQP
jgi:hypothetical protein